MLRDFLTKNNSTITTLALTTIHVLWSQICFNHNHTAAAMVGCFQIVLYLETLTKEIKKMYSRDVQIIQNFPAGSHRKGVMTKT